MEPVENRSDSRYRLLSASPSEVFAAMSDAGRIARWWGPDGFSSSIDELDFRPGGRWLFTMHGPDGKDYPNESRFTRIVPNHVFEIEHLNGHHFFLTITLTPKQDGTEIHCLQVFDSIAHYEHVAEFVAIANEQNLDRLAVEVERGS